MGRGIERQFGEVPIVAERISARQLIRVHISANTYVRTYVKSRLRISLVTLKLPGVTLRNAISHAQISGSHGYEGMSFVTPTCPHGSARMRGILRAKIIPHALSHY